MTQNSEAQQAAAMEGMHPATSATSNLYDENVTPTNDDGLRAIYGAEPQPPALFHPLGDDPHLWKRYLYSPRNTDIKELRVQQKLKEVAEILLSKRKVM